MTNAEATTNESAAAVAQQGATVAPEKAPSKKGASQKKAAPQGQKTAKGKPLAAKPKRKATAHESAKPVQAKKTATPRTSSKGSKILALIGRSKGATLAEIMTATDWQAHSVRGFLSTVSKKRGLKIESTRTEAGERTYRIAK